MPDIPPATADVLASIRTLSLFTKVPTTGTAPAFHDFAAACLIVNGLLDSDKNESVNERAKLPEAERFLHVAADMAAIVELNSDSEPLDTFARATELWLNLEGSLKGGNRFNALFHEKYGVTIDDVLRVLTWVYARTYGKQSSTAAPWHNFVINETKYFDNLKYGKDVVQKVLHLVSCRREEAGNMIVDRVNRSSKTDFSFLQRYPLIQVTETEYIFCDVSMLVKFAIYGIWMCIEEAIDDNAKMSFREAFGHLFENYCCNILRHSYEHLSRTLANHRLHLSPKFGPADEVCDALIEADDSIVVIEAKGIYLTPNAKFVGVSHLRTFLDSKLIGKDQNGSRKGVLQLKHNCSRILDGCPMTNISIDLAGVRNIYPVIVVPDPAMAGRLVSTYLNASFAVQQNSSRTAVRPLTVLTITDLEMFTSVGRRLSLAQLLAAYRSYADAFDPLMSFRNFLILSRQSYIRKKEAYTFEKFFQNIERVKLDFNGQSDE